jgi:DMSO/TMAO reductase YedYZ molybdopterin-dependent catalytic subunit
MLFGAKDPKLQDGAPPRAEEAPAGAVISPDTRRGGGEERARIPPRQARTKKWPVLDAGVEPDPDELTPENWRLRLFGLVEEPVELTWEAFQKLPRTRVFADMHCVTRWSRLGNVWEGVSTREVLKLVAPRPEAKFVLVHAYDRPFSFRGGASDWTTNMPLQYFLEEDCLFADTHDGEPISREHGGPLRLVIPKLYAWKSAKWVAGVEFLSEDTPGFWERGGYHMLGDPWQEQRYRFADNDI